VRPPSGVILESFTTVRLNIIMFLFYLPENKEWRKPFKKLKYSEGSAVSHLSVVWVQILQDTKQNTEGRLLSLYFVHSSFMTNFVRYHRTVVSRERLWCIKIKEPLLHRFPRAKTKISISEDQHDTSSLAIVQFLINYIHIFCNSNATEQSSHLHQKEINSLNKYLIEWLFKMKWSPWLQ
jgi:hypothetical protein